jgi:hypothetical protein
MRIALAREGVSAAGSPANHMFQFAGNLLMNNNFGTRINEVSFMNQDRQ